MVADVDRWTPRTPQNDGQRGASGVSTSSKSIEMVTPIPGFSTATVIYDHLNLV